MRSDSGDYRSGNELEVGGLVIRIDDLPCLGRVYNRASGRELVLARSLFRSSFLQAAIGGPEKVVQGMER